MKTVRWQDCLDGPRSLGTAPDCAVVAIEDPGLIEIHAAALEGQDLDRLGFNLPSAPWTCSDNDGSLAIWVGPGRWWIMLPHALAADVHARVPCADLTGAYAALKMVGPAALEILARFCTLDFATVPEGEVRGTTIAEIRVLVRREPGSVEALLLLAPRSAAGHLARLLVETARDATRLNLFEPAPAPAV